MRALVPILIGVGTVAVLFLALWIKEVRQRRDFALHSITSEDLYAEMHSGKELLLFDVRQPLDVLTDAEMIPGARRVPPKEIEKDPTVMPRDKELVVYCTCPNDATARMLSRRAQELQFMHVKFLKGGLGAWKQRGYPVEPYRESFRLDTAV